MAEVLVLVEQDAEGALKKVTSELITAARALGTPSAVVVGKPGSADGILDGLKEAGAEKIYVAESDDAGSYLITPQVDVLASIAETASPAGILVAATADGKEIAGRLAVPLGSGVLADIVDVKEKSLNTDPFVIARETAGDRPIPGWLQVVGERQRILVHQLPERAQIDVPLTEQLIVELYSK